MVYKNMLGLIVQVILIIASIAGYYSFIVPMYDVTSETSIPRLLETQRVYQDTTAKVNDYRKKRDALIEQSKKISDDDRAYLEKLLPDNVNNVKLVLEIDKMARDHQMTLKDVQVNSNKDTSNNPAAQVGNQATVEAQTQSYGSLDMAFSVQGTYYNFISMLSDFERSLRVVDISTIEFTPSEKDQYVFNFKTKTYWLR